jgi:hypothetical protein
MFNLTKTAVKDLIERVIRTFVGVFIPMLIASGVMNEDTLLGNADAWESAGVAGLAAAGSLVLGFILSVFGPKNGTTSLVHDVVDADVIRALDQPQPPYN